MCLTWSKFAFKAVILPEKSKYINIFPVFNQKFTKMVNIFKHPVAFEFLNIQRENLDFQTSRNQLVVYFEKNLNPFLLKLFFQAVDLEF